MSIAVWDHQPRWRSKETFRDFITGLDNGQYYISVEPVPEKRSMGLNAYYRKVIVRLWLCEWTGYSELKAHEWLLYYCSRKYDPDEPGVFTIVRTREMDRKHFASYVKRVREFLWDFFDMDIPDSKNFRWL
jgi:transposase